MTSSSRFTIALLLISALQYMQIPGVSSRYFSGLPGISLLEVDQAGFGGIKNSAILSSLSSVSANRLPDAAEQDTATLVKPTLTNVSYGMHERHAMDFWKAESESPTPLVFVIHGGGWMSGDKNWVDRFVDVAELLDAGISVVSINYRFIAHGASEGMKPPVKAPLYDAARALQFVRSKAGEWNIDKQLIGAAGASAGACSALWLAFYDDMADPLSTDPVARESTRLHCVAVIGAQTTLDPKIMKEWIPNSRYGWHAFGIPANPDNNIPQFDKFLANREHLLDWINEYSPSAQVSAGDPPVYLSYSTPPAPGQQQGDPTHSANFGLILMEKCIEYGVDCELNYPGASGVLHHSTTEFLIRKLTKH